MTVVGTRFHRTRSQVFLLVVAHFLIHSSAVVQACDIKALRGAGGSCANWDIVTEFALRSNTSNEEIQEFQSFVAGLVDGCSRHSTLTFSSFQQVQLRGHSRDTCKATDSDCIRRILSEDITVSNTAIPDDETDVRDFLSASFFSDLNAFVQNSKTDAGLALFITNFDCASVLSMAQSDLQAGQMSWQDAFNKKNFRLQFVSVFRPSTAGCWGLCVSGLCPEGSVCDNGPENLCCTAATECFEDDSLVAENIGLHFILFGTLVDQLSDYRMCSPTSGRKRTIIIAVTVSATVIVLSALLIAIFLYLRRRRAKRLRLVALAASIRRSAAKSSYLDFMRSGIDAGRPVVSTTTASKLTDAENECEETKWESARTAEIDPVEGCEMDRFELLEENLVLRRDILLGKGTFSVVFKGFIKSFNSTTLGIRSIAIQPFADANRFVEVAVKVLRDDARLAERSDFVNEINFMKTVEEHPHVLSMIGCVSRGNFPKIVTHYCSKGDLLSFLRGCRSDSDNPDQEMPEGVETSSTRLTLLISLAWQVADGLNFLASKGFVHCDVSARNVLLTEQMTAKLNIGLCRLSKAEISAREDVGLPCKWMAPESLCTKEFTPQTDVWSFGVLLFEIFSLGETPYASVSADAMADYLLAGNRLQQPDGCPQEVFDLMQECWQKNADRRPRIARLRAELESILSANDTGYGYLRIK